MFWRGIQMLNTNLKLQINLDYQILTYQKTSSISRIFYSVFCQTCLSHHGWKNFPIYVMQITFVSQKIENRYFHSFHLCWMFDWLFCNCFVLFVQFILSLNCTLFFSVFANFIFSNFKTILLCHYVILLVSFNDSFIINL